MEKSADEFAFYYLVLFRPELDLYEVGQTNSYEYNWDALVHFICDLKKSNREVDALRYEIMDRMVHSWKTNRRNRLLLSKYRGRARTMWNREEIEEARTAFGSFSSHKEQHFQSEEMDEIVEQYLEAPLPDKREREIMAHVSFTNDLVHTLNCSTCNTVDRKSDMGPIEIKSIRLTPPNKRMAEDLSKAVPIDEDANDEGNDHAERVVSDEDIESSVNAYIESQHMSQDKMIAVDIMRDHFRAKRQGLDDSSYEAPFLLVTGGPGVGKSYLVKAINEVGEIMRAGKQIRSAYLGIAAVNIDGSSLCSLLNIPTEFEKLSKHKIIPWNKDKLNEFKQHYDLTQVSAVIIDEISTVKPHILAYIDARLREAFPDVNKPFAGLAVLLLGDFDQLPPVGGESIPATIMMREAQKRGSLQQYRQYRRKTSKFQITTVCGNGAMLFKKARRIHLKTQHRSEDPDHTMLLDKMSKGHSVKPADLSIYKTLKAVDTDFQFATILTSANREKHEFNMLQGKK